MTTSTIYRITYSMAVKEGVPDYIAETLAWQVERIAAKFDVVVARSTASKKINLTLREMQVSNTRSSSAKRRHKRLRALKAAK